MTNDPLASDHLARLFKRVAAPGTDRIAY